MSEPTFQIIRTDTEFGNLREAWGELHENSEYPNIFTSWDWQSIWWKHFGGIRSGNTPSNELLILLIRSENCLVGIVPFYRKNSSFPFLRGRRHLTLIGYGGRTCPEYLGLIVRKGFIDKVVDATVGFLKKNPKEWDSIFLEDYALDDPATALFAERLKQEFLPYGGKGEIRYTIPLPDHYEDYLKSLGSHNRKGKRSRMNQAKKLYSAYATYPSIEQIDEWFPLITSLTLDSRLRRQQDNPFLDEVYIEFHRELLKVLLPRKQAVIQFLYFNDKPVSCWYAFLWNEKCYAYQQGSKTDVKGSPGDVGTLFLLDWLMQKGFKEFDFLRGLEWYKTSYTDRFRETAWLFVFRKQGPALWSRLLIDRWIKPAYHRIRSLFSTFIGNQVKNVNAFNSQTSLNRDVFSLNSNKNSFQNKQSKETGDQDGTPPQSPGNQPE